MSFKRATSKIRIGSLDVGGGAEGSDHTVVAQYNPGTLEVSQNVPWKKPDAATQAGGQGGTTGTAAKPKSKKDENYMALEFTGAEGRSITVEMLFDGYETDGEMGDGVSVSDAVKRLEKLARVRDPSSDEDTLRRPHHCVVVWGGVLPRFECVIESLTTKYTMFSPEGEPLRATCTVKLKEAKRVDKEKGK
ncbi:MAG: hypothetical protein IPQ07_34835 [Myxococcales bacterium]|nr:hypothetical protein [Myxococcales bacterium]